MKKILICTLAIAPLFTYAHVNNCATVGASMESWLFDAIQKDLKIDVSTIQKDKTEVEIITTTPVSVMFAEVLAKLDRADSIAKGKATIPESEYFSSYYENGAQSITAKYTYISKTNKKDVFIASSLMNKDECSIRFNGYITLSREF
jgi:hypothetical protein